MRVAVIGAKGPGAGQGGIEHHSTELYSRMVRRGHRVDLFGRAPYLRERCRTYEDIDGLKVIALPCPGHRGTDAMTASALGSMLSLGRYDVVHFHGLGPALFSWMPRLTARTKVVVTCHGLDWQRAKWGGLSSRVIRAGERVAVRAAHTIIVVSDALRGYFAAEYDRDTVCIPNAPATYSAAAGKRAAADMHRLTEGRYVLCLGRLVPEKRPDLAIQAFRRLAHPEWKMVFVGGSSDTDAFAGTLRRLAGGQDDLVFAGECHGDALARLVRGAGLLLHASDMEGLPLAVLEAMAENLPVVASDIPPHRELLGDDRGLLFGAGDPESCARALDWAITHREPMRDMATRARDHVRTAYNWDAIVDQTLHAYAA